MHLVTLKTEAGPRAAVRDADRYLILPDSDDGPAWSLRQWLESGRERLDQARDLARRTHVPSYPVDCARLLPPIPDPRKIIGIGRNYREHAAETGSALPQEPILFAKYPTALIGQDDAIVLPAASREVDFEAELVAVIGRRGRHVRQAVALAYVAGYTAGNDVSARDWQLRKEGRQWTAGKSFDTFAPTGPELVTADEVPDPQALSIQSRLNGQIMQESATRDMVFSVAALVAYCSEIFTLEPGDLIFTGTPPGVGFVRQPPVFLKAGDVVEIEIGGIGLLRNQVREA